MMSYRYQYIYININYYIVLKVISLLLYTGCSCISEYIIEYNVCVCTDILQYTHTQLELYISSSGRTAPPSLNPTTLLFKSPLADPSRRAHARAHAGPYTQHPHTCPGIPPPPPDYGASAPLSQIRRGLRRDCHCQTRRGYRSAA